MNTNDAVELYMKRRQDFVVFCALSVERKGVWESMSAFSLETCQIFHANILIRLENIFTQVS